MFENALVVAAGMTALVAVGCAAGEPNEEPYEQHDDEGHDRPTEIRIDRETEPESFGFPSQTCSSSAQCPAGFYCSIGGRAPTTTGQGYCLFQY